MYNTTLVAATAHSTNYKLVDSQKWRLQSIIFKCQNKVMIRAWISQIIEVFEILNNNFVRRIRRMTLFWLPYRKTWFSNTKRDSFSFFLLCSWEFQLQEDFKSWNHAYLCKKVMTVVLKTNKQNKLSDYRVKHISRYGY